MSALASARSPLEAETRMVARALGTAERLAPLLGVPDESLRAVRSLARWALELDEPSLAALAWESAARLDDGVDAWLGLARAHLASGDRDGAWRASARVLEHPGARAEERGAAHLVLAQVCLAARALARAREHLVIARSTAGGAEATLARAIEAQLDASACPDAG